MLVKERFNDVSVADRSAVVRSGVDAVALADRLVATMTRHMLTDGHFHADPHPGYILLLDNGDLGLLDGSVRTISPGYSLIAGMRRMFDPRATSAAATRSRKDQLLDVLLGDAPSLQRLPAKVDRIATLASRGELGTRVSLLSTEQDVLVVTRLLNRLLLAVIGSVVGLASAILVATGSRSSGEPALPEVLGYLGLGIAVILVLRVVATVVRDGHN